MKKESGVWVFDSGEALREETVRKTVQSARSEMPKDARPLGSKRFFDTSVLIAVVLGQHTHHSASLALYRHSEKRTSVCGAHSLTELYAVLTRLPGKQRMNTDQVLLFLDDLRKRLTVVFLTEEDHYSTLSASAGEGILGGYTMRFLPDAR